MVRTIISIYYFISYSIGIATLFLCFLIYRIKHEKILKYYFVVTLCFAIIIVNGTIREHFNLLQNTILAISRYLNYLSASVLIFVLPLFIHKVYEFARAKFMNLIFLIAACISFIVLSILNLVGLAEIAPYITMSFLGVSMLYSIFFILFNFQRKTRHKLKRFSQYIAIISIILFPAFIYFDFYGLDNIIQTQNNAIGPLALPGFFIIWCGVYMVLQVKELIYKPVSILEVPAAFQKQYGITGREKEIVELLFKGLSYKEIMVELNITMPTVKSHISNIYRKTNTTNKIGLALLIKKKS